MKDLKLFEQMLVDNQLKDLELNRIEELSEILAKEFINGVIILIMMENFKMMHLMVMVNFIGAIVNATKGDGQKEICKVKDNSFLMIRLIRARYLILIQGEFEIIREMEKESEFGKIEKNTLKNGRMVIAWKRITNRTKWDNTQNSSDRDKWFTI